MPETSGFSRGMALLRRHLDEHGGRGEFELLGRTWDLLDGVFSPALTPVTGLFSSWLPYPAGGEFLEVGSGAGVTAVVAALSGCRRVTALDINAAAVANTGLNALRHAVAERVRVLRSDLFGSLAAPERFDLIFWNSNFVKPPPGHVNETDLHHSFFDPGYAAHRRYLQDAPRHLTADGRLILGFSSLGNWPHLRELCAQTGLDATVIRTEARSLEVRIEFQLVEFRPTRGRAWSDLVASTLGSGSGPGPAPGATLSTVRS